MALFDAQASKSRLYKAGKAKAVIDNIPVILIGLSINVQRGVSPIPTLTDGTIFSASQVQGSFSAQSILTENGNLLDDIAGKKCTHSVITVEFNDDCNNSKRTRLTIQDAFFNGIGISASGQQGFIANDLTAVFTALDFSNK